MGWTFTQHQTRQNLINELLSEPHHETLDYSLSGNELWTVKRYVRDGVERRYIALFLLRCHKRSAYPWGYKDMDETMGPYYYKCPQRLLDIVPCPDSDTARAWREKVVAHRAARRPKLKQGDRFELKGSTLKGICRVVSEKPLRAQHEPSGVVYPIKPRFIGERVPS